MAGATVQVTLDRSKINNVVGGAADASAERAARATRERAEENAPVDTGQLRDSLRYRKNRSRTTDDQYWYTVGSPLDYAVYQNRGVEGPITPTQASVLRFKVGGTVVFTHSTSGVPATHFLTNAYQALSLADFLP